MKLLQDYTIWFLVGSQPLYGEETLRQVKENAQAIVDGLNKSGRLPLKVELKPVLTTPDSITDTALSANADKSCAGVITWMHTFSPAKMWISGLMALQKPMLHLHTQFNRDLPWGEIDMDFMNLNQAAHGDREFGFINARLRTSRKVVAGHWSEEQVQDRIAAWMRAARAWADLQGARFARFGDNMREVAVTDGNKVSAQAVFGYSVNGYGSGDLADEINQVKDTAVDELVQVYLDSYKVQDSLKPGGKQHDSLKTAARIEIGLETFLEKGNFKGFTDTFEDLHGIDQLPGLPVQRLMAKGYGFGAEGDWKTAALVRSVKVMAHGLSGGSSFMEDYTYHLDANNPQVLGAHMLEICESIAADKPSLEIHPLGIGGKADPVRLVFDTAPGEAVNVSVVELGNRYRMIVNPATVVNGPEPLPNLPVARALWEPKPDFKTAVEGWIHAGGAHHTAFSMAIGREELEDFAEIAGIECLNIDEGTTISELRQTLRTNEVYYYLNQGFSS